MEDKKEKSCQACAHNRIDRRTPIYEGDDGPDICGIDYNYRCIVHDMVVPRDYWCDKFELPF